jgi:hypothetical protein
MDRIGQYRSIVKNIIAEHARYRPSYGDVEVETVFDDERGHYELIYAGWNGYKRVHGSVIHVDVKDGKVYVQHDGIEDGITPGLMEAGIPQEDIVLAFHHPEERKLTGFAVG